MLVSILFSDKGLRKQAIRFLRLTRYIPYRPPRMLIAKSEEREIKEFGRSSLQLKSKVAIFRKFYIRNF